MTYSLLSNPLGDDKLQIGQQKFFIFQNAFHPCIHSQMFHLKQASRGL